MNSEGGALAVHPLMMWSLIAVSILLVAVITYVYTNRNRKVTAYFTLGSIFFLGLIKIVSFVDVEIDYYDLDRILESGGSDHFAGPGWNLIWNAWFIWLLPAIISGLIVAFLFLGYLRYKKVLIFSTPVQMLSTQALREGKLESSSSQTRADRLNVFMALDAAKQQVKVTQQKLTESLLINTSNEIQIGDLKTQISSLETELSAIRENSTAAQNTDKLEEELAQKNAVIEKLTKELTQSKQDLEEAQDLLKKLAGISGSE